MDLLEIEQYFRSKEGYFVDAAEDMTISTVKWLAKADKGVIITSDSGEVLFKEGGLAGAVSKRMNSSSSTQEVIEATEEWL